VAAAAPRNLLPSERPHLGKPRQPETFHGRESDRIREAETAIATPELKKHWQPSQGSFARLLAWLDGGVDSNGESYVEMRRRLTAYFERRNCEEPEELADETLNRVSRRLEEEGELSDGPTGRYCHIVAKFVFLEHWRQSRRARAQAITVDTATSADPPADAAHLTCLERCLEGLPSRDKELILGYYTHAEREGRADQRRSLAARLGLSVNALAIRACRIRSALEECVKSCTAARDRFARDSPYLDDGH
jgi:DNA-directed RNA polymerase specialized sigma24 family protein